MFFVSDELKDTSIGQDGLSPFYSISPGLSAPRYLSPPPHLLPSTTSTLKKRWPTCNPCACHQAGKKKCFDEAWGGGMFSLCWKKSWLMPNEITQNSNSNPLWHSYSVFFKVFFFLSCTHLRMNTINIPQFRHPAASVICVKTISQ